MGYILVFFVWSPAMLALVAGYLGRLHPGGDSFAVFRMEVAIVVLAVSLVLLFIGPKLAGGVGLVATLFALMPLGWAMRGGAAGDSFVLYQKNLLYSNTAQDAVIADIEAADPDVVTLQEVSARNLVVPRTLQVAYSHQAICPFDTVGAVAVLSRWPIEEVRCDPSAYKGLVAVRVALPDGPVWIASVHLHWPWPRWGTAQADQVARMVPVLEALEGPVVMAGDFNMVSWSATVRSMAGAISGETLGPSMVTRVGNGLALRIDHMAVSNGLIGVVERRGLHGSDHYGIVARIGHAP